MMTLGKVKRTTIGQLAHLSGPGGSDSGLGCLLRLGVKVGRLPSPARPRFLYREVEGLVPWDLGVDRCGVSASRCPRHSQL